MPNLTVEGIGTFPIPENKRLVLALEDEAHIDQLHACGGNARCTTCRVEFVEGEPARMTVAEKAALESKGASGVRLELPNSVRSRYDRARHQPIGRLGPTGRRQAAD